VHSDQLTAGKKVLEAVNSFSDTKRGHLGKKFGIWEKGGEPASVRGSSTRMITVGPNGSVLQPILKGTQRESEGAEDGF